MKRTLFYFLIVVVVAGWVGTLIARDAGYVLVSYGGATLQTSLWVMVGMLTVLGLGVFYSIRLTQFLGGANKKLERWGDSKKRNKSLELSSKGLVFFQEGNFERAEKYLVSGAKQGEYPAYNYIAAAKAVDRLGKSAKRENYLREALVVNPQATQAISVASAEMAAERGDWGKCLEHLKSCGKNDLTTDLKKRALIALEDWNGLAEFMPHVRKAPSESKAETDALEKTVVIQQLSRSELSDEVRVKIFKKAPAAIRNDDDVLKILCSTLENEKEAESIVRSAIKSSWRPALVEIYAKLGMETLNRRIKTAEKWETHHGDDATLSYCLGQLYELSGNRDKAKLKYERSIELGENKTASLNLANLLAFDGDFEKSNEYFRSSS